MTMQFDINILTSGLGLKKSNNGNYHCFNTLEHSHGDANASLSISENKDTILFNCFGCGKSGNMYDLVMAVKSMNYSDAKSWILHNASNHPDISKLGKRNEIEEEKRIQVRFINPVNKSMRYGHKLHSQLKLRDATEQDLANIYKYLLKDFTFEALAIANAKINGNVNDNDYAIVFSYTSYVRSKDEKTQETLIFEGQTDFLTALSVGLHNNFNLQLRFNKQAKFRLKTNLNYAILDRDDNESNIKSRIDNLNGKSLECLYVSEPYKDFSDYVTGENLTKNKQEVIDFIMSKVKRISINTSQIKNLVDELKFSPKHFDLSEVNDLIFTKDNRLNHVQVAELFKQHTDLIYLKEKSRKGFFHYEEGVWQFVDERVVMNDARILINSDRLDSTMLDKIQKLLQVVLFKSIPKDLDNYNVINYSNGVYDFDKMEFLPHAKAYYFFDKMDFSYDPAAKAPHTMKYLNEIAMNDGDLLSHLLESASRCLIKNTDGIRIIGLLGIGENGKSKFIKLFAMQLPFEQTLPSFDTAKLIERFYKQNFDNKKLVFSGDSSSELKFLHILKELTGNDDQAGEEKYKEQKRFQFLGIIILAANEMFYITDIHSLKAILRRLTIIPFNFKPTKIDNNLEQKFRSERSGFLNILIETLKKLKANENKITKSEAVDDTMREFRNKCHLIVRFLNDCNIKLDKQYDIKLLYESFKSYLALEYNLTQSKYLKGDLSPNGFAQAIKYLKDTNLFDNDEISA